MSRTSAPHRFVRVVPINIVQIGGVLIGVVLIGVAACSEPGNGPAPDARADAAPADGRADAGADGRADGSPLPKGLLILDNVTVVDANGKRAGKAVLIKGNTIYAVLSAGGAWPAGSTVIDAKGRFVIPGLVDPHVHLTYAGTTVWVADPLHDNLRATLYHGVTAVMDVGASRSIFALRAAIDKGAVVGPTLRATGPFITRAGSHPCESSPNNDCVFVDATDAGKAGQKLIAQGADAIKAALADTSSTPWPGPRLDVKALAEVAKLSVPVVAHVNSSKDVVDAVGAGVDVLAHPVFVGSTSSAAIASAKKVAGVHTTVGAFAAGPDLVDKLFDLSDPHLIVPAAVKANWVHVRDNPGVLTPGWIAASRKWTASAKASVTAMRKAGVKLVPGSDAGYLFVPHGLGLHVELRRLAALGFKPLELLRAATVDARKLIGLSGGTVTQGAVADLVLLQQDPTKSVKALAAIERVILRGKAYKRAELRKLDLLAGKSDEGEVCLAPADCKVGLTCDRLAHICRPSCAEPYAPVNGCGPGAWCMPLDGQVSTAAGVCRPEPSCQLYGSGCGPGFYAMSCYPLDSDTSGCRLTGAGAPGQSCSSTWEGTTCKPGHFCSSIGAKCYQLCDPKGGGTCLAPLTCEQQMASATVKWFGLCL